MTNVDKSLDISSFESVVSNHRHVRRAIRIIVEHKRYLKPGDSDWK
jgi:hypothetical protein